MKHINLGDLDVGAHRSRRHGHVAAYTGAGTDDAESIRTIHRALDLGVTLIDTAEIYGPYTNEELVGQAIKGRRDDVVLATKFGMISHAGDGPGNLDSSPANIRTAVEGSLQPARHRPHRPLLPAPRRPEDADRGHRRRARRAGRRGQDPPHRPLRGRAPTRSAGRTPCIPITALQSEYSLWTRDPEPKVLPRAARARHRLRGLLPARARLPHRRRSAPPTTSPTTTRARPTRASSARTSSATCAPSTRSRRSPPRSAPRPRRSRSPGCSRRATTSRRSPARSASSRVEENVARRRRRAERPSRSTSSPNSPRRRATTTTKQQMQMIER